MHSPGPPDDDTIESGLNQGLHDDVRALQRRLGKIETYYFLTSKLGALLFLSLLNNGYDA
jgi:hypothetical protein